MDPSASAATYHLQVAPRYVSLAVLSMLKKFSGHLCNPLPGDYWLDQGGCDWKCKGDSSQICGGNWRMNVYQTGFKI